MSPPPTTQAPEPMLPQPISGRHRAVRQREPHRSLILAVLALVVLIVVMDLTILNIALGPIQREFNASTAGLQWTLDAYVITFAAFIFTGGVSADRLGAKRTLLAGLAIFGIASGFAAYSSSIDVLIAWRAVMGIGAAAVPTGTLAIILHVFTPEKRPKAIAVWAAAAGAAFAVGPVLAGVLLSTFWWGSVFLINVPLIVLALIAIVIVVPTTRPAKRVGFDPVGVVLSIMAVGAIVFGIVVAGEDNNWTQPKTLVPLLGGLVLVGVLLWAEKRVAWPTLDTSLFAKAQFTAGTSAIALSFFSLMGAIFIITFYLQLVRGYSPLEAGLLMLPMGVGSMFMSARCPKLVARLGGRVVVAMGAALMAAAFGFYGFSTAVVPVGWLIAAQLVFGLGWGCIMAPATAALMSVVPLPKSGAGQAVSQTLRQVGAALGIAVVGSIMSITYRSSLGDAINVLPSGLRHGAASSIGATGQAIISASQAGLDVGDLAMSSVHSYMDGMHVTMMVIAGVSLLVVGISLRWLPARSSVGAHAQAPATPATAPARV